jgi:hypothetical protein
MNPVQTHVHAAARPDRRCFLGCSACCVGPLAMPLLAALAGCGGGGSGDGGDEGPNARAEPIGPPAVAATLSNTAADAGEACRAAVDAADGAITRVAAMGGLFGLIGTPVSSGALFSPLLALARAGHTKRALRMETLDCQDILDLPCSGSATVDTNIADTATAFAAGDYADVRFNGLNGRLFGVSTALQGRMRLDFVAPFDLNASTLAGLDVLVTLDQLGGHLAGHAFGPVSDVGRLQVSSSGVQTITASGRRYSAMRSVSASAAGSYSIGSGGVRMAHWSTPAGHVDIAFTGWRVLANRPQPNALATLTAGTGRVTVRVTSSSSARVGYAVVITLGGAALNYTVTATYPAGGGAPVYTAVPA